MITFWAWNVHDYHIYRVLVRLFYRRRSVLALDSQRYVERAQSRIVVSDLYSVFELPFVLTQT